MAVLSWARWGAPALLLATGCGDALVDGEYRGVPLITLQGAIEDLNHDPQFRNIPDLRLSFFWSSEGPEQSRWERYLEQPGMSVPVQVPTPFSLNVFDPPPKTHWVHTPGGAVKDYAIGRLLVYQDQDHDGRRGEGEPFYGLDQVMAFLYAPRNLAAGESLAVGAVPAGIHHTMVPLLCGGRPPANDPGDCGVPFGQACQEDGDCGTGVCLHTLGVEWPQGACALPDLGAGQPGCRPAKATFFPMGQPGGGGAVGYFVKTCEEDADCRRPGDQNPEGYYCDVGQRACLPSGMTVVKVGFPLESPPLCAGH